MSFLQAQKHNNKNRLYWIFPCIIVLITLSFSFIGLSEFYNVAIKGETGGYPWGAVNEVPWYYQTQAIYSTYTLTSGLLFLTATILIGWATLKKSKKLVIAGISLAFFLFLTDVISANNQ